jgi:hypothetical protein
MSQLSTQRNNSIAEPADMPEGLPFGPGIRAAVAYLHGCRMVSFKRLTELCEDLFGLTIS